MKKITLGLYVFFVALTNISAQFQEQIIVYSGDSPVHDVYSADLNGDGKMDIIGATQNELIWFKNEGGHTYSEIILDSIPDAAFYSSHAADFNNDGLLDIVSATDEEGHISWYKNLDNEIFSNEILIHNDGEAKDVYAADLDNDGDMDVLVSSGNIGFSISDTISWFKNDGAGNFGAQQVLSLDVKRSDCVLPFDIDDDGDLDVFATDLGGDKAIWIENLGNGNFDSSQVIADGLNGAQSLDIADFDNDGLYDIFVCSRNSGIQQLNYMTYLGNGEFATPINVSLPWGQIPDIHLSDLNNDMQVDICVVDDFVDRVGYIENNGDGTFAFPTILTSDIERASSTIAADLDNDNDMELIYSGEDSKTIGYFVNYTTIPTSLNVVEKNNIKIFPNPFLDFVQFNVLDLNAEIFLYDINGRLISRKKANKETVVFNDFSKTNEMLFYKIINSSGKIILSGKLIKQ